MDEHMASHKSKLRTIRSSIPSSKKRSSAPSKKFNRNRRLRASGSSKYPAPKLMDTTAPDSYKYSKMITRRLSETREKKNSAHEKKMAVLLRRIHADRTLQERRKDPLDAVANPVKFIRITKVGPTAEYDYEAGQRKELFYSNPFSNDELIPVSTHSPRSKGVPFRTGLPSSVKRPTSARRPLSARRPQSARIARSATSRELRRPNSSRVQHSRTHRPTSRKRGKKKFRSHRQSQSGIKKGYENRQAFLAEVKRTMLGEFIDSTDTNEASWIPKSHSSDIIRDKNNSLDVISERQDSLSMRTLLEKIEGMKLIEGKMSDEMVDELAMELGVAPEENSADLLLDGPITSALNYDFDKINSSDTKLSRQWEQPTTKKKKHSEISNPWSS